MGEGAMRCDVFMSFISLSLSASFYLSLPPTLLFIIIPRLSQQPSESGAQMN